MQGMLQREAEAQIRSLAPGFPAVARDWAPPVGKNNTCPVGIPAVALCAAGRSRYPGFRGGGPPQFVQYEKTGAVLDEVQRVPGP
jgi:hypothetical protein